MTLQKNKFSLASAILFVLAFGCAAAYEFIGPSIDEQGILHEPFGLIPIGYLLAFFGLILGIAGIVRMIIRRRKK